jgi:hypothetical protein
MTARPRSAASGLTPSRLRQRPIDIGGRQTCGACANREARSARVLALDGQQPLRNGYWVAGPITTMGARFSLSI